VRILLTGGTGTLGRRVVPLLAEEHEVIALTRRGTPDHTPANVSWVRQDLAGELELAALPERVDAVVHLAQSERHRDWPDGADDLFAVNVSSTQRLLEYARRTGAGAFVLASTGGLYVPGRDPISEEGPVAPPGPYFRSKRMAELLAEDYQDLFATVVLRFFFVYGVGEGATLVPRMAAAILAGEEIVVEGNPGLLINPIQADDAAAAVREATSLPRSAIVNVAGAEVVSITDLVERLGAALGRDPRIRHAPGKADAMVADTARMRTLLRVEPQTTLDDGFAAVARSFAGADRA
jgi:UDP-glucose 4-epimerase